MAVWRQDSDRVDRYIGQQNEHFAEQLQIIREFILASDSEVNEWFKYGLPFYGLKKNALYLHIPAKTDYIVIGLMHGKLLAETDPEFKSLVEGDQKLIRHYRWDPENESRFEELAYLIDKSLEMVRASG